MASGAFEDEAEVTVSINEYIESMDAEELVMILFLHLKSILKSNCFLILTKVAYFRIFPSWVITKNE